MNLLKSLYIITFLFLITNLSFATIITPASSGTNICAKKAADGPTPAWTTLGKITVKESINSDFAPSSNILILNAPTGWQFDIGSTPAISYAPGRNISVVSVAGYTATSLTINVSVSGTSGLVDSFYIVGLKVRAINTTSTDGFIYATTFTGIAGITVDSNFGNLSLTPILIPSVTISTDSGTIVCPGTTVTFTPLPVNGGSPIYNWYLNASSSPVYTGVTYAYTPTDNDVVYCKMTATGCVLPTIVNSNDITMSVTTPAAILGTTEMCIGTSVILTDSLTGGSFTSSNNLIATIDAYTGIATGVSAGLDTITYTLPGGCYTTITITVDPLPATISGVGSACSGQSTLLTETDFGGLWTSDNTSVATVNSSGLVTGVSAGNAIVTYTTLLGCISTNTVTINPLPSTITGNSSVCLGLTDTLHDATPGGSWSIHSTYIALIDIYGRVFGVNPGLDTVSYTLSSTGCSTDFIITVNNPPSSITGTSLVCIGQTCTLSDDSLGGTWSSNNSLIATIDATSGVYTGVAGGTAIISYTLPTGCYATKLITVNPLPNAGTITGFSELCVGSHIVLSDAISGGTWSNTNTSVLVLGGYVIGLYAGLDTVTYTVSNSCGTSNTIFPITIYPLPDAGTITGLTNVCVGSSITLADGTPDGVWTISNTLASLSSGSLPITVTGISSGTDTVNYSVSNSCGTAIATKIININPLPDAGTIIGSNTVCEGSSITLSNAVTGGTWSSVNSNAVVFGGLVLGSTTGTDTISYSVTNSCGTAISILPITINPLPWTAAISGLSSVCEGSTITLTDITSGGIWTSVNGTANVTSLGIVTGISAGTDTIEYSVTNICGTATVTKIININPLPNAGLITGADNVCEGSSITLSETVTGGTWSSANSNAVVFGGLVLGSLTGIDTISYLVNNSCGTAYATLPITINPLPVAGTISGISSVCIGSTITLSESISGGVWTSSNASVSILGEVSEPLYVTGVYSGTDTILYSVSNSCGTAISTKIIIINSLPDAGTIIGSSDICMGTTTTYTNATLGGIWSISNSSATMYGGIVSGISLGNDTIAYSVTNGCGTTETILPIRIITLPYAGTIIGLSTVCEASSITLTDSTSGGSGTWSESTGSCTISGSSPTQIIATGVTSGLDTILYTVSNICGTSSISTTITINPLPNAGTISGISNVCVGSTITLTDPVIGGLWSNTNSNTTISGGGLAPLSVLGVSAGIDTILYSVTNTCGTAIASIPVYILDVPSVGVITGVSVVCEGAVITLTDTALGGYWSLTNSSATFTTSSPGSVIVTGAFTGIDTISYMVTNVCGSTTVTTEVTVNPLPNAGMIIGETSVCIGSEITLADSITGGSWSSSNSLATLTSNVSGIVITGVSSGTDTISYSITNSCGTAVTTYIITINPLPNAGTITGTNIICAGSTSTLSDFTIGTWSSSNTDVAVVSVGGVVSAVSAGIASISYTVTDVCGTIIATSDITVNPLPLPITGSTSVCQGSIITLSELSSGGLWSSSNVSVAMVTTTGGAVWGILEGNATISYTFTSTGCSRTFPITVVVPPSSIYGTLNVCNGATSQLLDSSVGGTWISNNTSVATTDSAGYYTGISVGTAIITYSLATGCIATTSVTVSPLPSTIIGISSLCTGTSTYLSDSISGGSWIISNSSIATIDNTGLLTGITAGIDTVYYASGSSCNAIFPITIYQSPSLISGITTICSGSTTVLTDSFSGGSWMSSYSIIASIDSFGTVTGNSPGTVTMYYTLPGGCTTYLAFNVIASPSPIFGTDSICFGTSSTLFDSVSFGTGLYTSSNNFVATIDTFSGIYIGIGSGISTITYTISNGCYATKSIYVSNLPSTIIGIDNLCIFDSTTISDSVIGGTWSNTDGLVSISPTGMITGIGGGIATISYTLPPGCFTTMTITINTAPNAGIISGTDNICYGVFSIYSDTALGGLGTWSSSNSFVASISGDSVLGNAVGNAIITYSVSNSCGTDFTTKYITVDSFPIMYQIYGLDSVCPGATITLSDSALGGTWSCINSNASNIDSIITGITSGIDTISYSIANGCGISSATKIITINSLPDAGIIYGSDNFCVGDIMILTYTAGGGTWSASNTAIATVFWGIVTCLSPGTDTLYNTFTNTCGSSYSSFAITVNPTPSLDSIYGPDNVCVGSTITISSTGTSGIWSSSDSTLATITSTGIVYGLYEGVDSINYIENTGFCGIRSTTLMITVNPLAFAGSITGLNNLCEGSSVTLTDTVLYGWWTCSNSNAYNIDNEVTGISAGLDTVLYIVENICNVDTAKFIISINPLPHAGTLSGPDSVCAGTQITLVSTSILGNWSITNSTLATVVGGLVTGISEGLDTIMYKVTTLSCGDDSVFKIVSVLPQPNAGVISGSTNICIGSYIILTDTATGGIWSGSNTNTIVAHDTVTGVNSGSNVVYYIVSNSCGNDTATKNVFVIALPDAGVLSGSDSVCVNSTINVTPSIGGGIWSATNTHASISSGIVTGFSAGIDTIKYKISNTCGIDSAIKKIVIKALPFAGTIIGKDSLCVTSIDTLLETEITGYWVATNTNANVVPFVAGGLITALSAGFDTIMYIVSNTCGFDTAFKNVYIDTTPAKPTISGASYVCIGGTKNDTLSYSPTGGVWTSSNSAIVMMFGNIAVGVNAGVAFITYSVSNQCGFSYVSDSILVHTKKECDSIDSVNFVEPLTKNSEFEINIYPNPSNGDFTIDLPINVHDCFISVTDVYGKMIESKEVKQINNNKIQYRLNSVPKGNYFIKVISSERTYRQKIDIW